MTTDDISFGTEYYGKKFNFHTNLSLSEYRGKLPYYSVPKLLPYYSTTDDRSIVDISVQIKAQLSGYSDATQATIILQLLKDNVEYVTDEERFGREMWEIPAYVLKERQADCDGLTNLYVSIAKNIGLDVVTVLLKGHMCPAVYLRNGQGRYYIYNNKKYYHIETTSDFSIVGAGGDDLLVKKIAEPLIPTKEFKSMLYEY